MELELVVNTSTRVYKVVLIRLIREHKEGVPGTGDVLWACKPDNDEQGEVTYSFEVE